MRHYRETGAPTKTGFLVNFCQSCRETSENRSQRREFEKSVNPRRSRIFILGFLWPTLSAPKLDVAGSTPVAAPPFLEAGVS